jgi:uncharacterized damage-inducible protein DinB
MTYGQSLIPEFEKETALTRKALARVPDDRPDWKPHPKSFSLAHLAQLVATMPSWITSMLTQPALDLAKSPGYRNQSTASLLAQFDAMTAEAIDALRGASDEDMAATWTLRHGDRTLYSAIRRDVVRETINHMIHHRAQLTVYLRLLDVPVPSMYGPTADEPWGSQ